jgi:hypothetical protein
VGDLASGIRHTCVLLNIHLQNQVNMKVTKICKSGVSTLQLVSLCVPSLGEIRTWNLKHAKLSVLHKQYSLFIALGSNVTVMLLCGLDCRNYFGMACC